MSLFIIRPSYPVPGDGEKSHCQPQHWRHAHGLFLISLLTTVSLSLMLTADAVLLMCA